MEIIKNNYQEQAKNSYRSLSEMEKGEKEKINERKKIFFKEGK